MVAARPWCGGDLSRKPWEDERVDPSAFAQLPPPLSGRMRLEQWNLGPATLVPVALAGVAYVAGVRRLRRTGTRWPGRRTSWFFSGLAAVLFALASPIDVYAEVLFSVHMAQHVLLMLVAPPLLALGAPVSLALRASSPVSRRRLQRILHSRAATLASNPVFGWTVFALAPFALHFSPIYNASMHSAWLHAIEHGVFLSIGLVYWWPIVGVDPSPHRVAYPVRIFSLLLAIPAGGFLSLALFSPESALYSWYASLPAPYGGTALADQRSAAALMWVVGGLILVVSILVETTAWKRSDEVAERRRVTSDAPMRPPA